MKKLRIFDLLSSIKVIELKRFNRYIKSDSLFASRDFVPLVNFLIKFHPEFVHPSLTLETMYNSLYPGKKFNKRVIISRLSELNRMVENFMLSVKIEKDPGLRTRLLAECLMQRNAYDTLDLLLDKQIHNELNIQKISDRQLYELDQLYMLKGQSLVDREDFIGTGKMLEKNIEIFLIYFLSRLLTMYCGIYNVEMFQISGTSLNILSSYMDNINVDKLVKSLSNSRLSSYMNVLAQVYKLYREKNNDNLYFKVKKELLDKISEFEQIAKFTVFSFLYSYSVQQINNRRKEFINEMYDILTLVINHEAYMKHPGEWMPSMLFREVVLTGLKLNDTEGVKKFIDNNTVKLSPYNRELLSMYSNAKIFIHKKQFDKALYIYDMCPKRIPILDLDIRIEKLVCLYELEYFDRLTAEITKNRNFLNNKDTMTVFQKNTVNLFNNCIELLYNYRRGKIRQDKLKIEKILKSKENLTYREWIAEKLDSIIKAK